VLTTKAGSVAYNDFANVLNETTTLANVEGNLTNALVFCESYNVLRYVENDCHSPWKFANCRSLNAHSIFITLANAGFFREWEDWPTRHDCSVAVVA